MGIRNYKWRFLIYLVLLGLILLAIGYIVFAQQNSSGYQRTDILTLNCVGGNSVVGPNLPYFPDIYILGVSGIIEVDECLYHIIKAESNFDPNAVNKKFGEKGGMGLGQIIPNTLKYCEDKLGRELDPYNPDDNLECALWLYENEGTGHWGCLDCQWGSYDYWKTYCNGSQENPS